MTPIKVKVIIDKRSTMQDGTHPLKVYINNNGTRKYYGFEIGFKGKNITSLKESTFMNTRKDNPREPYKRLKMLLNEVENRAYKIVNDLEVFSFKEFEKHFYKLDEDNDVFSFFDNIIKKKESLQKLRTADSYKSTKAFLGKFVPEGKLTFNKINNSFLEDFEIFSKKEGLSTNGFAVYLRTLKALYNSYYRENDKIPKIHAFGKFKIKSVKPQKRALSSDQIKKISEYECDHLPDVLEAKQIFILSYLMMGINYNDLVQIKWDQIKEGRIYWVRQKTSEPLSVKLNDKIQEILDYLKKQCSESEYILSVLDPSLSPVTIKNRTKKALKRYNKQLQIIAEELKLEVKLTSYFARHSYATQLLRNGQPVALISQGLGHRDIKTTENYLSGFETSDLDKANENLLK